MRRVAVAAMLALTAGCGQDAPPPPPPPAKAPVAAPPRESTTEDVAARLWDAARRFEEPKADVRPLDPSPAPEFALATLDVWDVRHEAKRIDVRDTTRTFDKTNGEWVEVPIDGTANPAKSKHNEVWARKAEALARRDAVLLAATHTRFREMFAEPLRLPALRAERLPLRAVVHWDRTSFDAAMMRAGTPVSPDDRAIWHPAMSAVVTYTGDASLQSLDEWTCADDRVQKESDQVLAAAGAVQLLREYARVRGSGGPDERTDEPSGPRWFTIGLSEMLGGVETSKADLPRLESGSLMHDRIVLGCIATGRQSRLVAERWTIEELLRPGADEKRLDPVPKDGELPPPPGAFRSRAWAFCHFLWNYDGGKYRDRFVAFVGRVLDGTGTSEVFAKEIMGRPSLADWGDVEIEFEWYWSKLLERKIGRDRTTKEWFEPSTEPPQGTVDDEFRARWTEKRKR
jgi:hypothetical protein